MKPICCYRSLILVGLLSFNAVSFLGCALELPNELADEVESVNENPEAFRSWQCDFPVLGRADCQNAIADIRAQANAAGRSAIIERGIHWLEDGNSYDRDGAFHEGYRRDCSGFVSMCWELSQNPATWAFPPRGNNTYAVELPSFADLLPGDAVNKKKPGSSGYGHIMLFAGWASANELYFIHHSGPKGQPVSLIKMTGEELGEYSPIRSINLPPSAPQPPVEPPPAGCGVLLPGQVLFANQAVYSCDGRFELVQQGDGNLVLYMGGVGALWWTDTHLSNGQATVMKEDGELIVLAPDWNVVWQSHTAGNPGAWLAVQDDGNVVIYGYANQPLWHSGTYGH